MLHCVYKKRKALQENEDAEKKAKGMGMRGFKDGSGAKKTAKGKGKGTASSENTVGVEKKEKGKGKADFKKNIAGAEKKGKGKAKGKGTAGFKKVIKNVIKKGVEVVVYDLVVSVCIVSVYWQLDLVNGYRKSEVESRNIDH